MQGAGCPLSLAQMCTDLVTLKTDSGLGNSVEWVLRRIGNGKRPSTHKSVQGDEPSSSGTANPGTELRHRKGSAQSSPLTFLMPDAAAATASSICVELAATVHDPGKIPRQEH